jgi:hypothetical protein
MSFAYLFTGMSRAALVPSRMRSPARSQGARRPRPRAPPPAKPAAPSGGSATHPPAGRIRGRRGREERRKALDQVPPPHPQTRTRVASLVGGGQKVRLFRLVPVPIILIGKIFLCTGTSN